MDKVFNFGFRSKKVIKLLEIKMIINWYLFKMLIKKWFLRICKIIVYNNIISIIRKIV